MRSLTYHLRNYLNPFLLINAILFGALQAWVNRNGINPDGVSYLDIGDAYFRGDWHTAINAMWSPLYSWLLGGAMFLIKPTLFWEYPVAHLVNFFIYLGSLICFRFFLGEIVDRQESLPAGAALGRRIVSESAWMFIGYLLFIWSSFVLIRPHALVPDMCVAALVYLAAGLVLRVCRRGGSHVFAFALLGIVLGFSYLAKAPMLLLSLVFLVVAAILIGNFRKTWPRLLLALSCFAFTIAPFIVALSISKDRVTFGDSGKLNYAWYVNWVPSRHWQGENSNQGFPAHPTRKVFEVPAIYEFSTPLKVTYPVWYDPSYWYEGVDIHLIPAEQLRVAARNILVYSSFFSLHGVLLLIGLVSLFYLSSDRCLLAKSILRQWFLLIPAMAALAMYSLIHVEGRYVAPFIVMAFLAVIWGINSQTFQKRSLILPIIFAALLLSIGAATLQLSIATLRDLVKGESSNTDYSRVAAALRNMGVQPGDKVASLGHGNTYSAKWARLAKIRIVSEIYEERDKDLFWASDPSIKQGVIDVFRKTGASLVVAKHPPQSALTNGWQQLDSTDMYVYFLTKD